MVSVSSKQAWTYSLKQELALMGRVFPEGTEFVEVPALSDAKNITFRADDFDFTVPRNGSVHTTIHRSSLVIKG